MRILTFFSLMMIMLTCITSCNDCEDCENTVSAPSASFSFINARQLQVLSDSIQVINTELELISTEIDTLTSQVAVFTDSLTQINTLLLDSGFTEYRDDSLAIQLNINTNNETLDSLQIVSDSLSSVSSILTIEQTTVSTGLLLVDTVTNLENGKFLTYEDSTGTYSLPIDVNSNSTAYHFVINGNDYQTEFGYATETVQDVRRRIQLQAFDLTILSHSFDSLELLCGSDNCVNNETTFVCYF